MDNGKSEAALKNGMKIVDVIPIARGISVEKLSYFLNESATPITIGSIVTVPLRKKLVPAVVVSMRGAEQSRAQIRAADFELRKLSHVNATRFFLPEFIEACEQTADDFACSTGAILHALTSRIMREQISKIKTFLQAKNSGQSISRSRGPEKYALQAPDEERLTHYKSFIREQFARKSSVFFCLPSTQNIKTIGAKLEKGIAEYVYILDSGMTAKKLTALCTKILAEPHPILILATAAFLSLPREDIGAIIVEQESSRAYKTQNRPYLDMRTFAERLATKIGAAFIVGDFLLRTETIYRCWNGEFHELYPLKFRPLSTADTSIIDMRKQRAQTQSSKKEIARKNDEFLIPPAVAATDEKRHFTLLSDQVKSLIEKNSADGEHLFVFCARKGLAPTTVCSDCGTLVTCKLCGNPTVLHGSNSHNFFLCHHCGERRSVDDLCVQCGSWRLTELGIGTERVAKEISEKNEKIFILDKEKAPTHKKALAVIADFYHSPGSILVGTEMALSYLDKPIENSAVAGIDSFFSLPDFRINEKVLGILLRMRGISQKNFVIQTRNPEQKVFGYALHGNLADFYRNELALRKTFSYPPWSTLIKISLEGKRDNIAQEMSLAKKLFEEGSADTTTKPADAIELEVFPSFIKGKLGKSILHALLKIPQGKWPSQHLLGKLRSLPAYFSIRVDPESLL